MLTSVIIGGPEVGVAQWQVSSDKYGNDYISNRDYNIRLRLGRNVDDKLDMAYQHENRGDRIFGYTYNIANNISIGSNNKNLNLTLLNYYSKEDDESGIIHSDEDIIALVVDNSRYKLLGYNAKGVEIIQTAKKRAYSDGKYEDKYQTAICKTFIIDSHQRVMQLTLLDLDDNKFWYVNIYVDPDGKITDDFTPITNNKKLQSLKRAVDKHLYFKVEVKRNTLLTNTYITTSKRYDEVVELTKDIPNAQVVTLDDYDPQDETTAKMLQELLVDDRVKMITEVGVRLDKYFSKTYKLLYVFDLITDEDGSFKLRCIKSN